FRTAAIGLPVFILTLPLLFGLGAGLWGYARARTRAFRDFVAALQRKHPAPKAQASTEAWRDLAIANGDIVDEIREIIGLTGKPGDVVEAVRELVALSRPAEGEDIMVNTPYEVFTLPLQPSELSGGLRFVVHVPGPEQPAAVDEAMVFRLAVWMAKHDGCDDPHRLIYEGSPPVLWGEVWNRYEYDARAA